MKIVYINNHTLHKTKQLSDSFDKFCPVQLLFKNRTYEHDILVWPYTIDIVKTSISIIFCASTTIDTFHQYTTIDFKNQKAQ